MGFNRIFITGGTGYLGKSLLEYRIRHPQVFGGAELVVLARDPDGFCRANATLVSQPGLDFVKGDVRDFPFPDGDFDAVIGAASPVMGAASDDETMSVNVQGMRRLLEFARRVCVKKALFTSSGAVYGKSVVPIAEDAPLSPLSAYGRVKLEVERMCVASDVPTVIVRIFAQAGKYVPRMARFAYGDFLGNCLENVDIVIKGDGTPVRSFMFSDDTVEWLAAALEMGVPGRSYNVGSDQPVSILELAETMRDVLGSKGRVVVLGNAVPGVADYYVPDVTRAKTELGVRVKVGLREAIEASVSGLRS